MKVACSNTALCRPSISLSRTGCREPFVRVTKVNMRHVLVERKGESYCYPVEALQAYKKALCELEIKPRVHAGPIRVQSTLGIEDFDTSIASDDQLALVFTLLQYVSPKASCQIDES